MNWMLRTFACMAASLFAILLPAPTFANCVLFLQLLHVDDRARGYLRSDAGNELDRRLSLRSALLVSDQMLEGLDAKAFSPFLDVRRELAHVDMSSLRENERDDYLLEIHQTRRDIDRRGESWGCVGLSRGARPESSGEKPSWSTMSAADRQKLRRSDSGHDASARSSGALLAGWTMALGMIIVPCGLGLWTVRRSRMSERYFCKVPCTLHAGAARAQGEIVDISRLGAKIKTPGIDVTPGHVVNVSLGAHRIILKVAWRNGHYLGGPFKTSISRSLVRGLSSGRQTREGAGARGKRSNFAGESGTV